MNIPDLKFSGLNAEERINFKLIRELFLQVAPFINHGQVFAYNGTTPPDGAVEADGSLLLVKNYPNIFAEIGYINGGSGESFNLPDWSAITLPADHIWIMWERYSG